MILDVKVQHKAIELRRLGKSYSDIARELGVSRASVCSWVKNVRLTEAERILLEKNVAAKKGRARLQASITLRTRKVFKEKVAYDAAEKEFEKLKLDSFFMFGLALFGMNERDVDSPFQFTASDPKTVDIVLKWLEKYLEIHRKGLSYRLFVAISHKEMDFEGYWAKTLAIPRSSFHKTVLQKHTKSLNDRHYRGSLGLTMSKVEAVRRIIAWQKLTMLYYS